MGTNIRAAACIGVCAALAVGALAADGISTAATGDSRPASPAASTGAPGLSDGGPAAARHPEAELVVYKSPTCGCCSRWVDYMKANGYTVVAHDTTGMAAVKQALGVPAPLGSCHTATVRGYVIEGHVPAADVKRLLEQRPAVAGVAVPGMPMGSPGMEGSRTDAYEVMTFDKSGGTAVFSRH